MYAWRIQIVYQDINLRWMISTDGSSHISQTMTSPNPLCQIEEIVVIEIRQYPCISKKCSVPFVLLEWSPRNDRNWSMTFMCRWVFAQKYAARSDFYIQNIEHTRNNTMKVMKHDVAHIVNNNFWFSFCYFLDFEFVIENKKFLIIFFFRR